MLILPPARRLILGYCTSLSTNLSPPFCLILIPLPIWSGHHPPWTLVTSPVVVKGLSSGKSCVLCSCCPFLFSKTDTFAFVALDIFCIVCWLIVHLPYVPSILVEFLGGKGQCHTHGKCLVCMYWVMWRDKLQRQDTGIAEKSGEQLQGSIYWFCATGSWPKYCVGCSYRAGRAASTFSLSHLPSFHLYHLDQAPLFVIQITHSLSASLLPPCPPPTTEFNLQ